jgi:hypothetical protein
MTVNRRIDSIIQSARSALAGRYPDLRFRSGKAARISGIRIMDSAGGMGFANSNDRT